MKKFRKKYSKVQPKVFPKVSYAGGVVLGISPFPNLDELVSHYIGTTSADGTELLVRTGDVDAKLTSHDLNCLLGDGINDVAVAGLETTDVFTVDGGSGTPTCTVNGTMDLANTDLGYGITVTRAGTVWAFFPCEAGEGVVLEDTANGNDGVLSNVSLWSTRDTGELLILKDGYSIDRAGGPQLVTGDNYTFDTVGNWIGLDCTLSVSNNIMTGVYTAGTQRTALTLTALVVGAYYKITTMAAAGDANCVGVPASVGLYSTFGGAVPLTLEYQEITFTLQATNSVMSAGMVLNMPSGSSFKVQQGFSVKKVYSGFSVVGSDGMHYNGGYPTYPAGSWAGVLNAVGILWSGDSTIFASVPTFAADAQVDITSLVFNPDNQTFNCDRGMVNYDTVQDAASIAKIEKKLCL